MASRTTNTAVAFFIGVAVGFTIGYIVFKEEPAKPPTPTHIPDNLNDNMAIVFIDEDPPHFEMCIPISCESVPEICQEIAGPGDTLCFEIELDTPVEPEEDAENITYDIVFTKIECSEESAAKAYRDSTGENLIFCFAKEYDPESLPDDWDPKTCYQINELMVDDESYPPTLRITMNVSPIECPPE